MNRDRTSIAVEEYRSRARDLTREAVARSLEGVLVWSKGGATLDSYANVMYLTNHYSVYPNIPNRPPLWVDSGFAACLVTREGEVILISGEEARRDLTVADRYVAGSDLPRAVADVVTDLRLDHARLGLIGVEAMVVSTWRSLCSLLPAVEWIPADDILTSMRMVKSEAEVFVISQAAKMGDAVMRAMLDGCVPGASEAEVAATGYLAAVRHGAVLFDLPAASGPQATLFSGGCLPSWSMRRLEEGDLYHSDMYGSFHGYFFDFGRSTVVGTEPTSEQSAAIEGAIGVVEAVLAELRPGATAGQVYEAGAAFVQESGIAPVIPMFGHGLGLAVAEPPWIVAGDECRIEANMYLSAEALLDVPGVGMVLFEQNVLVTENGAEVLSTSPPRPWQQ